MKSVAFVRGEIWPEEASNEIFSVRRLAGVWA
jgi:hypothetical protein